MPVYNISRAQGRNLIEFTLALAVLGSIGIEWMLYGNARGIRGAGGVRGNRLSLGFLLALLPGSAIALSAARFVSADTVSGYLASNGFSRPELFNGAFALDSPNVYPVLTMMFVMIVWLVAYRRFRTAWMRAAFAGLVIAECLMVAMPGGVSGPSLKQAANLCGSEPYADIVRNDPGLYRIANIFRASPSIDMYTNSNLLANLTCRQSYINAYDPLCPAGITSLLDLWLSGYYTDKWDLLLENNSTLSMLGVKYLKVENSANVLDSGITAAIAPQSIKDVPLGAIRLISSASAAGGVVTLEAGGGEAAVVSSGVLELKRGLYAISVSARVPGEPATGRLWGELAAFGAESGLEVFQVITDDIKPGLTAFNAIFKVSADGVYVLDLLSASKTAIELRDISLKSLEGYAPMPLAPEVTAGTRVYRKLAEQGGFSVYQNLNALPRAWAVRELIAARDIYDVKRLLETHAMNPAQQAALAPEDIERIGRSAFSPGTVEIAAYSLDEVELKTTFPSEGFVVLADQYYPGWRAYLDGSGVPVYSVNGMLRGVAVPSGAHSVRFIYRPRALMAGLLAGGLLFLAGLGYVVWASLSRRRDDPGHDDCPP